MKGKRLIVSIVTAHSLLLYTTTELYFLSLLWATLNVTVSG